MDSTRPERTEIGLLVVVVLKAQHLHDPHHFSKQDPFVEVEVSNSERARTRVDPDGGQQPGECGMSSCFSGLVRAVRGKACS